MLDGSCFYESLIVFVLNLNSSHGTLHTLCSMFLIAFFKSGSETPSKPSCSFSASLRILANSSIFFIGLIFHSIPNKSRIHRMKFCLSRLNFSFNSIMLHYPFTANPAESSKFRNGVFSTLRAFIHHSFNPLLLRFLIHLLKEIL